MRTAAVPRIVAATAIMLTVIVYYGHGLAIQVWPDSLSYLVQANGIAGLAPFQRPGDRTVGYPAFIALALQTPRPALAIVIAQALIAVASLVAVYRALTRVVLPRCRVRPEHVQAWKSWLLATTSLAALYSGLHVHITGVLTEILFAGLALAAVLAAVWLLRPDRRNRRPWIEAPAAAAVGALPLLVKPHWLLAAAGLAVLAGVWLWRVAAARTASASMWRSAVLLGLALGLTLGAATLATLPDRIVAERYSPREHALFGPRSAFCNHAHLIAATLERRPTLTLQQDPGFETRLRALLRSLVARHTRGWRLLGFDGDLCTYSAELKSLLDQRFADYHEQGRFLLGSVVRAALADPLPYARKIAFQLLMGFTTAFDRYGIRTRTGIDPALRDVDPNYPKAAFFAGLRDVDEVGPLGNVTMKKTLAGHLVQVLLAATFVPAAVAFVASVLAALVLPSRRWRDWSAGDRRAFAVFLAVPLGVLFAHHLLIALVHSFDVWRYAFNMYFVNLYFLGASALFWLGDGQRWRRPKA